MKRILSSSFLSDFLYIIWADGMTMPQSFNDLTAAQLVGNIKCGWNLGDTLDCHNKSWYGKKLPVSKLETAWGNPVTAYGGY